MSMYECDCKSHSICSIYRVQKDCKSSVWICSLQNCLKILFLNKSLSFFHAHSQYIRYSSGSGWDLAIQILLCIYKILEERISFLTSTNTWFLWQAQLFPGQLLLTRIQFLIFLSPTLGYLLEFCGWQTVGSPENQRHKIPCLSINYSVTQILYGVSIWMNTYINSYKEITGQVKTLRRWERKNFALYNMT